MDNCFAKVPLGYTEFSALMFTFVYASQSQLRERGTALKVTCSQKRRNINIPDRGLDYISERVNI